MDFSRLVEYAADLHCFSPGMVTAGERLDQVRVQLSRWVTSGRVIRIHKGWYTLSEPYRRVRLDLHVVACMIKGGSYVSMESALAFHGAIPENVPETTCMTTGRPIIIDSPFGRFRYRHVKGQAFFGYLSHTDGLQDGFVAVPEKALLDLLYLTPGSENRAYLSELRLQGAETFDFAAMRQMADRFESPRLVRSVGILEEMISAGEEWV